MIFTFLKWPTAFTLLLLLQACLPHNDDLASICRTTPELCADLHPIGDCRYQRTTLIRARYYNKIAASEDNTRTLLNELYNYETCLELTLLLQFTRNKYRKKERLENYITTQKIMKKELNKSRGTKDPHLAYYLWTRHNDIAAKKVFLSAANKKNLKDISLLIKLATVYSKTDPQKSLNLFYKVLKESHSIDDIPHNVFTLIMTIYYQNMRFEDAYVWALISQENDPDEQFPINLDLILQKGLTNGPKIILNADALEDKADAYYQFLEDGVFNFKASKL